ncbi:MAG TPA: Gfo/Idh/MocA family oxidoreductase, partial [Chloroflexota bacterium]|nr:Gfo/Idh/MocA family oxidoreductase [Chloroflexota bacterium]
GAAPRSAGAAPTPLGHPWPNSHAAGYALFPAAEVVAVCDLKPELLDQFRRNWDATWPGVATYTDYRALLERERIDLLSVVTPDHVHAQIVVDGAAAGVKGILCEKPIATSLADADRMIDACERHDVVMSINHHRRWEAIYHAGLEQLRAPDGSPGPLGPVQRIVATFGAPRGMLFRNGTHLIDTVCWLAGAEPEWVAGALDPEHDDYGPRYTGDGGRDPSLDPGGSGLIRFTNGVQAYVTCSKRLSATFELDVFCESGRLRIDDNAGTVYPGPAAKRAWPSHPLPVAHPQREMTVAALTEIVDRMEHPGLGETSSPPTAARMSLAVILGILQSHAAGNAPIHFPVKDA